MEYERLANEGDEFERLGERLKSWLASVPRWHDHFVWSPIDSPSWSAPSKPLNQCKVALVTSAGIHLKTQEPFDLKSEYGDWSYREIPFNANPVDLVISDIHYDHSEADIDINCLFPISHVLSLKNDGVIGDVASNYFGFMGFIPDPKSLIDETAPKVAEKLTEDNVDLVFLTPG